MRSIRTIPLVALLAMAAAALAAPAIASATSWTSSGTPISAPTSVELDGYVEFASTGTGMSCPAHGEATLYPGRRGQMSSFELAVNGCEGSGALSYCSVESATADTPSAVTATADGKVDIELDYVLQFDEGCSGYSSGWEVSGEVTATPDNSKAISSLSFGESVPMGPPGSLWTEWLEGEFEVTPAGKVGIGSATVDRDFSGGVGFNMLGSGVECETHLTLAPGLVTAFEVNIASCEGFGEFAACELLESNAIDVPWSVTANGNKSTIHDLTYEDVFTEGYCGGPPIVMSFPEATAILNDPKDPTTIDLSGEGSVMLAGTWELPAEVYGSLFAD